MEQGSCEEKWLARYVSVLFGAAILLLGWLPYMAYAHSTVTIASSTLSTYAPSSMYRTVVFTNDTTGYVFYVWPNSSRCVYQKTTDAGLTWANPVTIDSVNTTDCLELDVWYDQWTPGDSGNYIHIVTFDSGDDDTWYVRLDTTNDSLSTATSTNLSVPAGQALSTAADDTMITKSTTGVLFTGVNDTSGVNYITACSTTCTTASNWSSTTNPFDQVNDFSALVPLSAGQILLVQQDISAELLRSKVYNGSAWDGSWTPIDLAVVTDNSSFDGAFSVATDPTTSNVYLAYTTGQGALNDTTNDIRAGVFNGSSWSTSTYPKIAAGIGGVTTLSLGITDGAIYVAYATTSAATGTNGEVQWKYSTTSMLSWSATSTIATSTATTTSGLSLPAYSLERMFAVWTQETRDNVVGLTIADIFPSSSTAYIKITGEAFFNSTLAITGALAKGWGTFLIDHPLQPFRRLLAHSFLESPEVKNMYDGVAQLSPYGEAIVQLPPYFEALNQDFRYQYSPLTEPMPNLYIKQKIANNRFVIAGGVPGGKVSWQVTGIRHDPYIEANPVKVEVEKGPKALIEKGVCLFEPLCK